MAPAPTRILCPLLGPDLGTVREEMRLALARRADAVELRLDCLRPPPSPDELAPLLADCPLPVLVTCRHRDEGGQWTGTEDQRIALLRAAAPHAAWVDVEHRHAPDPPLDAPLVRSWHDFHTPDHARSAARAIDAAPAAVTKVAFAAPSPADALLAFDLLRDAPRPTIALAMGECGVMTRILARKFGAFATFASLQSGRESAPAQPTIDDLRSLYRWDAITQRTSVFGVIGCPVGHSMSPAIHNAAFGAAGLDAVYVPLLTPPTEADFRRLLDGLRERPWLGWRGLSVTIPHKEHALAYVGAENCDALARRIGAVNTITIDPDGSLHGDNTDYAAAIDALVGAMGLPREGLADRRVALLGAGGAARAILAALRHYGAEVTLYNRTLARAQQLVEEFGGTARPIDDAPATRAEIVINCTPLGMHPHVDASPLDPIPPSVRVVFDTIYNPIETRLLRTARAGGRLTVSGVEMFVNQAVLQFERWTRRRAPRDAMRDVVLRRLGT